MKKGTVVSLVTLTGEFVGKFEEETAAGVVLTKPRMLVHGEQGMGFAHGVCATGKADVDSVYSRRLISCVHCPYIAYTLQAYGEGSMAAVFNELAISTKKLVNCKKGHWQNLNMPPIILHGSNHTWLLRSTFTNSMRCTICVSAQYIGSICSFHMKLVALQICGKACEHFKAGKFQKKYRQPNQKINLRIYGWSIIST